MKTSSILPQEAKSGNSVKFIFHVMSAATWKCRRFDEKSPFGSRFALSGVWRRWSVSLTGKPAEDVEAQPQPHNTTSLNFHSILATSRSGNLLFFRIRLYLHEFHGENSIYNSLNLHCHCHWKGNWIGCAVNFCYDETQVVTSCVHFSSFI